MQIREAAALTGVPPKTIRYYEQIGLISEPPRTAGGYRDYGNVDLESLRFIKRARDLGFSIKDISSLLNLWHDKDRSSAQVKALTQHHILEVERRIAELQSIRDTLTDLSSRCHGDDRPDCPIIEEIAAGTLSVSTDVSSEKGAA